MALENVLEVQEEATRNLLSQRNLVYHKLPIRGMNLNNESLD